MHAEHPFATAHSQRRLYATEAWRECLARLDDGLGARERFVLVTGETGTGKTTLLLEAASRWGARAVVAWITNPALTRAELVEEIARRFAAEPPPGSSKPKALACVERALAQAESRSQVPVLVVDDAHQLDPELLDELRLLVNAEDQTGRPFEIVLIGSPALDALLATPACEALRQRIAVQCRLTALSHKDTRHYLHHRVRSVGSDAPRLFPRKTCSEIHDRTRGVPRAINTLAAEALRLAKAAGSGSVLVEHVNAAAAQLNATPRGGAPAGHAREPISIVPATRQASATTGATMATPSAPASAPAPVGAAVSSPRAPVPTPPPAPAFSAPKPRVTVPSDATAEPPSEPAVKDPRVSDWVSRFVGSQGPPRIGSALGVVDFPQPDGFDVPAGEEPPAEVESGDASGEPSSRKPPLRLIVLEDLPDDLPGARSSLPPMRPRPAHRPPNLTLVTGVIAVALLATVLVLTQGPGLVLRSGLDAPATVASTDQPEQSTVPARRPNAGSASARRRGDATAAIRSSAPIVVPVDGTGAAFAAPGDSASGAPRPRLALDVGTYLDEDLARSARDRLTADSGLQGWIVPTQDAGGTSYRVILGVFRSEDRATISANSLLERGLISEARVVPMPSRRSRY